MKKILPILILSVLIFPAVMFAQPLPTTCTLVTNLGDLAPVPYDPLCGPVAPGCAEDDVVNIEKCGMCCAYNSIYIVTNYIFLALSAIAIILFLVGAFTIITAGGAPERVSTGRNYILYAIVGLAVAFLARTAPAIAKALIGA